MPASTKRKKRREPPKRTRRVSQPFDDRLEVRCYKAEKAHLAAEAKKRGLTSGDLIRFQLGDLLGPGPAEPVQTPAQDTAAPETASCDLSALLAERFGKTTGWAIMQIRLGKVTVGGEPWFHTEIPEDLVAGLAVAGVEPLDAELAADRG